MGCEERNNVRQIDQKVIELEPGLYIKEYVLGLNSFGSARYIFIQCTAEGIPVMGLTASYPVGKTTSSNSIILANDPAYIMYQELKKKYEGVE